jgi:hypothetical protein
MKAPLGAIGVELEETRTLVNATGVDVGETRATVIPIGIAVDAARDTVGTAVMKRTKIP